MHDRREEGEQFHTSEDVAETHSPSYAERNEVFGFLNISFCVDESIRIKFIGVFPQRRIHVYGVDERDNMTASWNFVTAECLIAVIETRSGKNLINCIHFSSKDLNERSEKGYSKLTSRSDHVTGFRMR